MTTRKKRQPDIGAVVETIVRKQGFSSMSSSRIPADPSKLQEALKQMTRSQLPGGTYIYLVTQDNRKSTYSIEKYGKHEYL